MLGCDGCCHVPASSSTKSVVMRAAFILTVSSSIQQHNARSYTDGSRLCTCSN